MTDKSSRSEHVRALLDELQGVLGTSEPLDPALEEPLRATLLEVRDALERTQSEGADESDASLAERAEALAVEFEAAHPTLAGLMNRLTLQLASLGI